MGNLGEVITLPERINAMKVASYDVQETLIYVSEALDKPTEEITLDELLEWIENDLDMNAPDSDIIFQDENGGELE